MKKLTDFTIEESSVKDELLGCNIKKLFANEVCLINNLEHVNWRDDALQLEICRCGIVGCQQGGWASIRRAGDIAIIMPAWSLLAESYASPSYDEHEYFPSAYLTEGAVYIEKETYCNTLCQLVAFPHFDSLSPLLDWEAAKLIQLEAPSSVLGRITTVPQLPTDLIAASSMGNFLEQVETLNLLLNRFKQSQQPIVLREATALDKVVTFYVDISGLPEWKVLSDRQLQYFLHIEPRFVIALTQ